MYRNLLFIACLALAACSGGSRIANDNLSNLYNPAKQEIKPEFVIFHHSTKATTVYFRLQSENLLYARRNESEPFEAGVKIAFIVHESFSNNTIVDSSSFVVTDTNNARISKVIEGSFEISALYPNYYVLRIFTTDINKNITQEALISIDKSSHLGRENFKVLHKSDNTILFSRYLNRPIPLQITCADPTHRFLYVSYYRRDFPLSPPPFNAYSPGHFDFTPDSFFVLERHADHTFDFTAVREGLFHIQTDTS
ncbi:MAG: hypothetical protein KDC37_06225, partial [Flavobacteriales bacterium]|nr:hypothetical protein [Flavobacteriales bacterium]